MGLNDDKTSNDTALEINLGEYGDLEVIFMSDVSSSYTYI
jgi:hypothetical protein